MVSYTTVRALERALPLGMWSPIVREFWHDMIATLPPGSPPWSPTLEATLTTDLASGTWSAVTQEVMQQLPGVVTPRLLETLRRDFSRGAPFGSVTLAWLAGLP